MFLASSMNTSCAFNTFIESLPWLGHFLAPWKEAEIIILPKPDEGLKFPQNLHPIRFLSNMYKQFKKLILGKILKHIEERNFLIQVSLAFEQITA
jgi:hypothetical protein